MHRIDPTAEIHTFDPFVDKNSPKVHGRDEFAFHSIGLGASDSKRMMTLRSIMAMLNHTHIDILKVDIEGARKIVSRPHQLLHHQRASIQ